MNFEQLQKWEQIRNKGRAHYILFHWGLLWGSFATAIMELLRIFANALPFSYLFSIVFLKELIVQWLIFMAIGSCAGWYSWQKAEQDYRSTPKPRDYPEHIK